MNSAKYAAVHLKEWFYTLAETRVGGGRPRYGALISEDQSKLLETSVRATEGLPGDVIECGIFRGGSTLLLCDALSRLSSRRRVFAVDTFEGMPPPSTADRDDLGKVYYEGAFRYNSRSLVAGRLRIAGHRSRVTIVPGRFETALPSLEANRFSLAFVDCDFFDGANFCLEWLHSRMSPGGILCVHDYMSEEAPGIARAVDGFCARTSLTVVAASSIAKICYE